MARGPNSYIRKADKEDVLNCSGCSYCGDINGPFAIDHIAPLVHGGNSRRKNLTKSCVRCNSSKGEMTIYRWILHIQKKRSIVYDKLLGYLNRLRNHRHRKTNPELQLWLLTKIILYRREHSRFTKILDRSQLVINQIEN